MLLITSKTMTKLFPLLQSLLLLHDLLLMFLCKVQFKVTFSSCVCSLACLCAASCQFLCGYTPGGSVPASTLTKVKIKCQFLQTPSTPPLNHRLHFHLFTHLESEQKVLTVAQTLFTGLILILEYQTEIKLKSDFSKHIFYRLVYLYLLNKTQTHISVSLHLKCT